MVTKIRSKERDNLDSKFGSPGRIAASLTAIAIIAISWWSAPGVTRPYPGTAISLGGLAAILGGILLWFNRPSPRAQITNYVAAGLVLWIGLSSLFSVDRFRSQQTLAAWIGGLGVFLMFSTLATSMRHWRFLIHWLCLTASALCAYGFSVLSPNGHLTASFSNQDSFSVVPMVCMFLVLSQISQRSQSLKFLVYPQAILFGLTVIRCSSRAALVGSLVGLAAIALSRKISAEKPIERKSRVGSLAVLFVAIVLTALFSGQLNPLLGRVAELRRGDDSQGVSMRMDVLVYGLKAASAQPLVGSGPGTFALTYQRFRPKSSVLPDYIYVNVAHNDYVEAAVEFGWPGFFLLGLLYLLICLRGIRLIRHKIAPWESRCLLGAIFAILGFSVFNFLISIPSLLFLQFAVMGLMQGIPSGSASRENTIPKGILVACAIAVGGGVWALFFGLSAARANALVANAQRLISVLRWEEAIPILDKASRLQPSNPLIYLHRGNLESSLGHFQHSKELVDRAGQDLRTAMRLSPFDPKILHALETFYENTKQYGLAEEVYIHASQASPYREARYLKLSQLQVLQEKYAAAAATLYEASLESNDVKKLLVPLLVSIEEQKANQSLELLRQWGHSDAPVANSLAKQAIREALKRKKPEIAFRLWNFARENDAQDLETNYLGSQIYLMQKKPAEQLRLLQGILQRDSKSSKELDIIDEATGEWARLQPDFLKHNGETLLHLSRRLKDHPKSIHLRLTMSEIYLRTGETEQASEVIARGLDFAPEDPNMLARMGTCVSRQGLAELAQGYFLQALKLDPGHREALAGRDHKPFNW